MADIAKLIYKKNTLYGGEGGAIKSSNNTYDDVVYLTQAEYDALPSKNPNTLYSTPEGESGAFEPSNQGTEGQVLTKTEGGYEWANASGNSGIENFVNWNYISKYSYSNGSPITVTIPQGATLIFLTAKETYTANCINVSALIPIASLGKTAYPLGVITDDYNNGTVLELVGTDSVKTTVQATLVGELYFF